MDQQAGLDLWNFAHAAYARPAVARACLALQDDGGANVMILLYLCWAARQGEAPLLADIERARARIGTADRHCVVPLRAARRALGQAARALDSAPLATAAHAALDAELRAERCVAALLAAGGQGGAASAGPVQAATGALQAYLGLCGLDRERAARCAVTLAVELLAHIPAP